MSAIGAVSVRGYSGGMPRRQRKIAPTTTPRRYPNRIAELTKRSGLNYATVGDAAGSHEITIAKLATGKMKLTQGWMERLARVFKVSPAEIIARPLGEGLRRVRVRFAVQAGVLTRSNEWGDEQQYDVLMPDDANLRNAFLYAGEVRGDSMNLRYRPGSVVVFSSMDGAAATEIAEGRRYHVRRTFPDGTVEDTIKTLVRDENRWWLKPESTHPQHQEWIAYDDGTDKSVKVELIGRVRYVVQRED